MKSPRVECRGRRVAFIVEEKALPNGHRMLVDKIVFPEAAAVLPLFIGDDGSKRVVLLRQYRPVIEKYIIEAPAGVVDPGETPDETAKRELEEETGLVAGELIKVASAYTSPGYSVEKLHLFIAINPSRGEAKPEEHEIIELIDTTLDEALRMISTGEIEDMKTIALLLAAARMEG